MGTFALSSAAGAGVPFSSFTGSNRSRCSISKASSHRRAMDSMACRGIGKDTVEGWIDLSKLVSGSGGVKTAYEDLAYKIGMTVRAYAITCC